MAQNFFYDGQIRKFIAQFIRIVSNFQVEFGKDRDGNVSLQRVPVFYGDQSRQAAQILRGNSENTLSNVPAMAVYISGFDYDRSRIQEPSHVSKMTVREQKYDPTTGAYTGKQADAFTIERLMPVPYKLTLKLDIWTSNTEQKLQIIEQIVTLFNPALEIQSTDNYIDWTSLSAVFLTGTNWDTRSVPSGGDEAISISTMTFELPIWISSPAKIKKMGVIHKIVQNIYDADGNIHDTVFDDTSYMDRRIITPFGYDLLYVGNMLTLLKPSESATNGQTLIPGSTRWRDLIDVYGVLVNGVAEIRLAWGDSGEDLIGTVAYHPSDPSKLMFTPDIDTFPSDTVTGGIDAIIDPNKNNIVDLLYRSDGTYEPGWSRSVDRSGQPVRYLILNDIGSYQNTSGADAWGGADGAGFVAYANDIIEWNGTQWNVIFDSEQEKSNTHYVTNLNTNTQYKWSDGVWAKSVEGIYREGQWSIVF